MRRMEVLDREDDVVYHKKVMNNPTRARYKSNSSVVQPALTKNLPGRLKGNRSSHNSSAHTQEQKIL